MSARLSFGIEREILVDELQFYFEQNQAAEFEEDDLNGMDSRKKRMKCFVCWKSMDDFMKMIYIRLYGSRKKMCYRIEKSDKGNKIRMNFAESETV